MKLLRLEMRNLASLEGDNVINFEEGFLKDSQIFCIVGPTGSGKSTILDAICLALYGRAPRYPMKKGDRNQKIEIIGNADEGESNRLAPTDPRNILTRGQKEGYSKLSFLSNDGKAYRAEWSVRFLVRNYAPAETRLYCIGSENEETECDWSELCSHIIGLDFEQFLRTVLIAQGSFANFLTAKEDERYELLEKIVGNGSLFKRIAQEVTEGKAKADEKYIEVSNLCGTYKENILPDEELTKTKESIEELEAFQKKLKEEEKKVDEALRWYADDEKQKQDIAEAEQKKLTAQANVEAATPKAERLSLHDATLPAVALYRDMEKEKDNVNDGRKQEETLRIQIDEKQKEIEKATKDLKTLEDKEKAAIEEQEKQKPHINKARTLKADVKNAQTDEQGKSKLKDDAESAKKKADQAVEANQNDIEKAKTQYETASKAFTQGKAAMNAKKAELQKAVEEATQKLTEGQKETENLSAESLQQAVNACNGQVADIKEAGRICKATRSKSQDLSQNSKRQAELEERNKEIADELGKLTIDSLKQDVEALTRTHTLMNSESWKQHRALLEEEKPCPLCGATHHPYATHEAEEIAISAITGELETKRKQLKAQETKNETLTKEENRNSGELQTLKATIASLSKEINGLQTEWKKLAEKHPDWQTDEEWLNRQKSACEKQAETASKELNAYNKKVKEIGKLQQLKDEAISAQTAYQQTSETDLEKLRKAKDEANTTLETLKGQTDNLLRQQKEKSEALTRAIQEWNAAKDELKMKQDLLKAEIGDKDPDEYEQQLAEDAKRATNAVTEQKEVISRKEQEKGKLDGSLQTTKNQIQTAQHRQEELQQNLHDWLSAYNRSESRIKELSAEEIAQLSAATDDWEKLRQEIQQCEKELTIANTTHSNASETNRRHQASKPDQEKEALQTRKTAFATESKEQELIDKNARLKQHNDATEKLGQKLEELQRVTGVRDDWKEIYDAIGGKEGKDLRKIAQCYTLRFLIEHANAEIRKFNSRYELEQVKNSLGIRVIDHDRLDDRRDTTSLSGGETFIVSLGLALGLSSLSSRNTSFENLFIDEGFGTLDPETLAVVINALSLMQSSQGKKVGVISHTDTMAEQITTQIQVVKKGNSGVSSIKIKA